MDTHLITQDIRLKQWAVIIQDRQDSGLSIDAYCEKNGLSRNAYFYWLRKLREKAITVSSGKAFVEIGKPEDCSSEPPQERFQGELNSTFRPQLTIQKDGIIIGIDSSTPKCLLEMALEVASNVQ